MRINIVINTHSLFIENTIAKTHQIHASDSCVHVTLQLSCTVPQSVSMTVTIVNK